MSGPLSFAIVGQFASGKTTLAYSLMKFGYERVSLAGRLKEIAADAFNGGLPVIKDCTYDVVKEDGTPRAISGRQVLQEFGQSVKSMDRDFWIRLLVRDIESGVYGPPPYVCDDCRFPYEAEALKRIGFVIVRVDTPDDVRAKRYKTLYGRAPTKEELSHPSETQVTLIVPDFVVSGQLDPYDTAYSLVRDIAA